MYSAFVRRGLWWKKTYKNVKGDLIMCDDKTGGTGQPLPVRVLILDDNSRVELPMNDTLIEFSSGRHNDIKERMENEVGRPIKTK